MSDEPVDLTNIPFIEDGSPIVIDYNRPRVEVPWVPPPPKQPEPDPAYWSGFLHRGATLFTYMVEHYEDMFDSETTIKKFDMYPMYHNRDEHEYFYDNHGEEINRLLTVWVRNEMTENRLFDSTFWRPLHNWTQGLYGMYMGYRKLFIFNDNYFQLIITDDNDVDILLGLVHHDYIEYTPDNMISEKFWNIKH